MCSPLSFHTAAYIIKKRKKSRATWARRSKIGLLRILAILALLLLLLPSPSTADPFTIHHKRHGDMNGIIGSDVPDLLVGGAPSQVRRWVSSNTGTTQRSFPWKPSLPQRNAPMRWFCRRRYSEDDPWLPLRIPPRQNQSWMKCSQTKRVKDAGLWRTTRKPHLC